MSLNRFMHPRNIYRTPPDFESMMKTYATFSVISKMDAKGKVTIDFKDPGSLRVLTKCLLKSDFNLDVEIPEDRLVPTLPLRLNYILWVEDLMAAIDRNTDVRGIDIGTGACAIYPLLGASKNKWFFIGTEMDSVSLQKAQENVQRNKLQELIEIRSNEGAVLIENLFAEDKSQMFDFCMCNPPFYSNLQELCESRSPARLPPKNGFTGSVHELITDGGELEFSRKLIKESKNCKNNVLIFTTMIGHKYNLSELLQDLKAENIKHTHTEFCQGRVTRWGLAWTYQKHNIYNLVPPRDKPRKKAVPVIHKLPELPNCDNNVENAYNKLKQILNILKINYRVLNKRGNFIALDIVAKVNTWSNQRRKKRQLKRTGDAAVKKSKPDPEIADISIESISEGNVTANIIDSDLKGADICSKIVTTAKDLPDKTELTQSTDNKEKQDIVPDLTITSTEECYQASEETEPLVQAFLKIFKKEDVVHLETDYLSGSGGKESLYQVIQFIKNNWKYLKAFFLIFKVFVDQPIKIPMFQDETDTMRYFFLLVMYLQRNQGSDVGLKKRGGHFCSLRSDYGFS